MKFKIRKQFFVQLGEQRRALEGETVDLTADQARKEAHKLEALDADATAFLDSLTLRPAPATSQVDPQAISALAASLAGALTTELASAGAGQAAAAGGGAAAAKRT